MKETVGFLLIGSLTSFWIYVRGEEKSTQTQNYIPVEHVQIPHELTTDELIKSMPLYYDIKRTEWYMDQIDKAEQGEQIE